MAKVKTTKKNNKTKKDNALKKYPVDITNTFYANGARVFYNQFEFALDFFQQPIRDDGLHEGIRLFINPENFKHFTNFFLEQMEKYEKQFGKNKKIKKNE